MERIHITYPCYLCKKLYDKGPTTVNHIRNVHNRVLPKRPRGIKRPKSDDYTYAYSINEERDTLHYGCSSCWFHTDDIKELQEHVKHEHDPDNNELSQSSQSESEKEVRFDINETCSLQSKEKDSDTVYDTNSGKDIVQNILELAELLTKLLKI